ncbi:MAG: ComEC/Rec2 family competence protein [Microgenomates group bacterium]
MIDVSLATAFIAQILPEPHAGLLAGILFGVKSVIPYELKNALQTTGTLHITALSGMNITILTGIFFSTFIVFLPRLYASILTIGVIGFFVWFVGYSPSVVRAAIMGCITLLTALTGYISIALCTWGITVVGMIVVHPTWVTDISFQLSVLASLGMILFSAKGGAEGVQRMQSAKWQYIGKNVYRWIQKELTTTLSAQVFTLPLILFTFGRISLISPLTNLLIGWTIPIITVLGLAVCLFGLFIPSVSYILGWGTWVFLEFVIRIVLWTGHIPFASIGR